MEKVTIRNAELGDISILTKLCTQLGYPANDNQISNRLKRLLKSSSDVVIVAAAKK